jgi:S1-C subfamily serine protease
VNAYPPHEDYRAFSRPPRNRFLVPVIFLVFGLCAGMILARKLQPQTMENSTANSAPAGTQTSGTPDVAAALNFDRVVAGIVKRAMPAVVSVHVSGTVLYRFTDPFYDLFYGPQRREISGIGSGVIVDPGGFIITNHHVITVAGNSSQIEVVLTDGGTFKAKVVRDFPEQDLAVLAIEGKNLPFLELGASGSVVPGQTVLAIGNPFGSQLAGEPSVTRGIISATRRNLTITDDSGAITYYQNMLQTDAAINPGNSGGALIDLNGRLIGVNTAIINPNMESWAGVGLAIPSDRVRLILERVRNNEAIGKWYTGIMVQDVTPETARKVSYPGQGGDVITRIDSGSPAEKCGLKTGDIITRVNGLSVGTSVQLINMFRGSVPGESFHIEVFRNGKTVGADLTLGSN